MHNKNIFKMFPFRFSAMPFQFIRSALSFYMVFRQLHKNWILENGSQSLLKNCFWTKQNERKNPIRIFASGVALLEVQLHFSVLYVLLIATVCYSMPLFNI